jgi:hypothetical protein
MQVERGNRAVLCFGRRTEIFEVPLEYRLPYAVQAKSCEKSENAGACIAEVSTVNDPAFGVLYDFP